jgi:hypothetical protein
MIPTQTVRVRGKEIASKERSMPASLGQLRVMNPVMTGLTSNCKNNKNAKCKFIK